jgi:xanthine dehydrogenase YagR molybdenum-binding subunit
LEEYSHYARSAVFAEVRLDEELGVLRRAWSARRRRPRTDPKTARVRSLAQSSAASHGASEETVIDHPYGRFAITISPNTMCRCMPTPPSTLFLSTSRSIAEPARREGVGKIGIVGTAAAIANAVFHATGVRVRDLPITVDKLLSEAAHEQPAA